jgi:hypothetical protein
LSSVSLSIFARHWFQVEARFSHSLLSHNESGNVEMKLVYKDIDQNLSTIYHVYTPSAKQGRHHQFLPVFLIRHRFTFFELCNGVQYNCKWCKSSQPFPSQFSLSLLFSYPRVTKNCDAIRGARWVHQQLKGLRHWCKP